MFYQVKQLAKIAGVSVRTLHYYDSMGILKPAFRNENGYRYYDENSVIRLQQILFFRHLGFSLKETGRIVSRPDFNVIEALQSHREILKKKAEQINELLKTIDNTVKRLKGEIEMEIREYYQGFSEEQVERYRREVRERWGEKTLQESEQRILRMGKQKFAELQAEGGKIFQAIADKMSEGYDSKAVQEQVARWRTWLENFHHYSEEAVLGLGRAYSQNPEFAEFFRKIYQDLPEFLTQAIEYYCAHRE